MSGFSLITPQQAADAMRQGQVIAYPTEAVYGLGCDPANEQAVRQLLSLKIRSPDAGLILIADRYEYFQPFIGTVSDDQLERAMASWPGPVTWLFPRAESVPDWLAGKHPADCLAPDCTCGLSGAVRRIWRRHCFHQRQPNRTSRRPQRGTG